MMRIPKPKKVDGSPYGPAMLALTPMQRKFVIALYERPGIPHTQALRLSGWKGTDLACKKRSYIWSHHEKVLKAIEEYGKTEYNSKLPLAVGVVDEILRDPNHRDRVKVTHGLLDRVGISTVKEVRVTHTMSVEDMKQQLRLLLAKPAMKPLLPQPKGEVVEAEYTEVEGTDD